jgi:uncharacterized membrane protein
MLFSDAVVAIAITLLAIELPVPEGDTVSVFWSHVRDNDGHYAAFLISFLVIAAAWSNHHDLFRYVNRTDARLRTFNSAWLLAIVLNPFGTKLLTASGHPSLDTHALRFGFYALLQVLESVAMLAMLRHLTSRGQAPDAPRAVVNDMGWQAWSLMARLRAVDPGLLRHERRLGALVRGPAADITNAPVSPARSSRFRGQLITGTARGRGRALCDVCRVTSAAPRKSLKGSAGCSLVPVR